MSDELFTDQYNRPDASYRLADMYARRMTMMRSMVPGAVIFFDEGDHYTIQEDDMSVVLGADVGYCPEPPRPPVRLHPLAVEGYIERLQVIGVRSVIVRRIGKVAS